MITLIIPTMNRSDFVIRLLHYYADLGFTGGICIGDSSTGEHIERTKRVVDQLRDSLNIVHNEYPKMNEVKSMQFLLDFVSTPYVAYIADDDFLVPASLYRCARFLDENSDYNAAHGVAAAVSLKSDGAHGKPVWTGYYRQPGIEEESASQRLLGYLGSYGVTLFSVHRAESWRTMFRDLHLLGDRAFAGELLPCCLSAIEGKVKEIDCLYLIRQQHGGRYMLSDNFDWITSPSWFSSYQVFVDCLAKALVRKDGIGVDDAKGIVKQAFWSYLVGSLDVGWTLRYSKNGDSLSVGWQQRIGSIPGSWLIWKMLHFFGPQKRHDISLPALMHSSSPYNKDFLSVCHAIVSQPEVV